MRTARWPRSKLLYATLIFAALATLGCQQKTSEKSTGVGVYPPCAQYKDLPDTYGYCLYKFSGGFHTQEEINTFCPQAGEWELECRHAWVSGRMQPTSGHKTEDLLQACGENPDCTFELLDFRPEKDILKQIDLCAKYVRKHIRDCVGHAMQRWWRTSPDADEVKRVLSKGAPVPDKVAYYAAASVQCDGIGTCEGEPYLKRLCEKSTRHFAKNPQRCPPKSEPTMPHKFSPKELAPNPKLGQQKLKKAVTPPTPYKGNPANFKPPVQQPPPPRNK